MPSGLWVPSRRNILLGPIDSVINRYSPSWWGAARKETIYVHDAAVGTVKDWSITAIDWTQAVAAAKPTFKDRGAGLFSLPYYSFDGTDSVATTSQLGSTWFATGNFTMFAVVNFVAGAITQTIIGWNVADVNNWVSMFLPFADDNFYYDHGTFPSGRIQGSQPAGWDDKWHILEIQRPEATGIGSVIVDGITVISGSFGSNLTLSASSALQIGHTGGSGSLPTGGIAELFGYKTQLSSVQRAVIRRSLSLEYGIAVVP